MYGRMKQSAVILIGALLIAGIPASARAQRLGDALAYGALTLTPAAGLPSAPITGRGPQTGWDLRYAHLGMEGGASNIAFGWQVPSGKSQLSFIGGANIAEGSSTRLMGGVELLMPLTEGQLRAGLRPSFGVGQITRGDGLNYAAAVSMPISILSNSTGVRVTPFVEPGLGFGGVTGSAFDDSGTRFMASGGLMFSASDSPLSAVISARKVFIQNGLTLYGIGLHFDR
jgi:hypothetical protein